MGERLAACRKRVCCDKEYTLAGNRQTWQSSHTPSIEEASASASWKTHSRETHQYPTNWGGSQHPAFCMKHGTRKKKTS